VDGIDVDRSKGRRADTAFDMAQLAQLTGDERLAELSGAAVSPLRICAPDGTTVYRAVRTRIRGYAGTIELWLVVDATDAVSAVHITRQAETRGFANAPTGAASPWLATFVGAELSAATRLHIRADGGSVDAISGATITSRAIVTAVADAALALANAPSLDCSAYIATSASAQP
jgi:Na+-translocating ferredoxin:NAD+ oxidoreductase RnfG subunit